MACVSLSALPRACGAEGIAAGIERLWMLSYNDLNGSPTIATNGVISAIPLDTTKKFVEIGLLKSTSGITEEGVFNTNGTSYINETLTLRLVDITVDNKNFVNSVMSQEVAAIVKSRTGKYYAVGLSGTLKLSGLTGGLGIGEGDDTGYTLTFSGFSSRGILLVEESAVTAALA